MTYEIDEKNDNLGLIIISCVALGIIGGIMFDKLAEGIVIGSVSGLIIGIIYEVLKIRNE